VLPLVDAIGLLLGAVIHPDDDVVLGLSVVACGERGISFADEDHGTGRVEADTHDAARVDAGLVQGCARSMAASGPDRGGTLFDEAGRGLPELEVTAAEAEALAARVEDRRARAAGPHVDADEERVRHGHSSRASTRTRKPSSCARAYISPKTSP
jgi:hypothetical protein